MIVAILKKIVWKIKQSFFDNSMNNLLNLWVANYANESKINLNLLIFQKILFDTSLINSL